MRTTLDARDREDHGHGHHDARKDEVGDRVVARDHVPDTHQSVTTFGDDADGDDEGGVASHVGGSDQEGSRG